MNNLRLTGFADAAGAFDGAASAIRSVKRWLYGGLAVVAFAAVIAFGLVLWMGDSWSEVAPISAQERDFIGYVRGEIGRAHV